MKKNRLLILIIVFFVFSFFAVQPASAQWALPAKIWNLGDDLDEMILNLTNWLLGFIVMAAVVAIIWGGAELCHRVWRHAKSGEIKDDNLLRVYRTVCGWDCLRDCKNYYCRYS